MRRNWACLLLVAVSRYSTSVRYRAAWARVTRFTRITILRTKSRKCHHQKCFDAISLTIVARMRSRHLSSKVDRCLSLLRYHLVKVNLQLAPSALSGIHGCSLAHLLPFPHIFMKMTATSHKPRLRKSEKSILRLRLAHCSFALADNLSCKTSSNIDQPIHLRISLSNPEDGFLLRDGFV
jgi:hypothetical protein